MIPLDYFTYDHNILIQNQLPEAGEHIQFWCLCCDHGLVQSGECYLNNNYSRGRKSPLTVTMEALM